LNDFILNHRALVKPSLDYNNWEADRIFGCACDHGWEGEDATALHSSLFKQSFYMKDTIVPIERVQKEEIRRIRLIITSKNISSNAKRRQATSVY
jgi:hypothetical protein